MDSSSQKLVFVLIVILGLAAGYIYYSQFGLSSFTIEPSPISDKNDLGKFESLNTDLSILENKRFKVLQIFGESPVNPGVTGKRDIFAPF